MHLLKIKNILQKYVFRSALNTNLKTRNGCFYYIKHLENIPEQKESLEKEFYKLILTNNQRSNTLKIETR